MRCCMTREEKAEAIKNRIYAEGKTVKVWATEKGYPITEVYKVLNGERKGRYGRANTIARELGFFSFTD